MFEAIGIGIAAVIIAVLCLRFLFDVYGPQNSLVGTPYNPLGEDGDEVDANQEPVAMASQAMHDQVDITDELDSLTAEEEVLNPKEPRHPPRWPPSEEQLAEEEIERQLTREAVMQASHEGLGSLKNDV